MPKQGQIIPLYTHPHSATYINDNTVYVPEMPVVEDGIRVGFVFTSGRGRDNVLLKKGNVQEYLKEYGVPNSKLYGQPGYMPYNGLMSEVTTAYCMRVMPDDAAYANIILVAICKWVQKRPSWDVPDSEVRNVMEVYYEARAVEGVVGSVDALRESMEDISAESTADTLVVPIAALHSLGRGVYGNGFGIRLVPDVQAIKQNNVASYVLSVLTDDVNAKAEAIAEVSLHPNVNIENKSLYIEDLVNDPDSGSKYIGVIGNESAMDEIAEFYNAVAAKPVHAEQFDVVSGLDIVTRKRYSDVDVLILPTSIRITGYMLTDKGAKLVTDKNEALLYDKIDENANPINLAGDQGVPFIFGNDGSFGVDVDPVTRDLAIKKAYTDAFMGKLDKKIKSSRRTPMDYMFDANYPTDVKMVLAHLVASRGDCQCKIDGGILNTEAEVRIFVDRFVRDMPGHANISYDIASYAVRDPFSGRKMYVTGTYGMVKDLPRHVTVNGIQKPFVGADAVLKEFVKNSVRPEIDADDVEFKEFLAINKINYVEAVGENVFQRGVQHTSQKKNSDLSEENNVRIMLNAKRDLEKLVSELSYDFTKPENIRLFTENGERRLAKYKSMTDLCTIKFSMSEYERKRNILHCNLEMRFNPMAKISIIEIDINPRQ